MSSLGGRDAHAGKSPTEMADTTIEMFERKAGAAGRYSPEVRQQATEAAQMLRDLKANDPAAFEAFGKGMQSGGNNKAYYGLSIGLEGYAANPGALKSTLSMIIQNPDNAMQTVNSRYTKEHPKFYAAEAIHDKTPVAAAATVQEPLQEAPSVMSPVMAQVQSAPSSGGENIRRREQFRPQVPQQAAPVEQGNVPYASPGMAIAARAAMGGGSEGIGFSGSSSGFSGLINVLKELMQKIANVATQSPTLTALGNDGGSLLKTFAGMTGTNPMVVEMSPNGQERDLGRARDIGQQQAIQETRTDPTMGMRGMGMN